LEQAPAKGDRGSSTSELLIIARYHKRSSQDN